MGANLRGLLDESIQAADEAMQKAKIGTHLDCQIDAMVALGEARLKAGDYQKAHNTLSDALQLSSKIANPKWIGACHLHLAETYIARQRTTGALKHLKEWSLLAPYTQNAYLLDLATKLNAEIQTIREKDYFLPKDLGKNELDFNVHRENLHKFLFTRAMELAGEDVAEASKMLRETRQSVYIHNNPMKYKKKRQSRASAKGKDGVADGAR